MKINYINVTCKIRPTCNHCVFRKCDVFETKTRLDVQTNKSQILISIAKQDDLFGVVDPRINQQISQLNRLSLLRNFRGVTEITFDMLTDHFIFAVAVRALHNGQRNQIASISFVVFCKHTNEIVGKLVLWAG